MAPQAPLREAERDNWDFFLSLPEVDRNKLSHTQVKDLQLLQPLFEFSGACAGCGETPYIKLLTQLFGDRLYIANATGCSSIYGGNLPTTPYTTNAEGRGPTWSNSLFEDNAEFGFGMRTALDQQKAFAEGAGHAPGPRSASETRWRTICSNAPQKTETEINAQRERVIDASQRSSPAIDSPTRANLLAIADTLVRKSVWILGGDGWAFDIGFGGLDHVLGSGKNVNVLVLDTEVYSNTGGQMSKATPRGAVAKFAAAASRTAGRTWPWKPSATAQCMWPRSRSAATTATCQGLPGGRGARRSVDHHRVLQLHRARLRPGPRTRAAEAGCAVRLLAADALQPGAARDGQESVPARFQGAVDPAQGIQPIARLATRCSRAAILRWLPRAAAGSTGRRRAPVARLLRPRRHAGPRRDTAHCSTLKSPKRNWQLTDCRR